METEKKPTNPVLVAVLIILPIISLILKLAVRSNNNPYEQGFTLPDYGDLMNQQDDSDSTLYINDDFVLLPFDDKNNLDYFKPFMKKCDKSDKDTYDLNDSTSETATNYYWENAELTVSENDVDGKYIDYWYTSGNTSMKLKIGLGIGSTMNDILDYFAPPYDFSRTYNLVSVVPEITSEEVPYNLEFMMRNDTIYEIHYSRQYDY
jgi:hypothetical protein